MIDATLVWSEKLSRKQSDDLIQWGKSIQMAERERIIELLIAKNIFCNGHWKHECSDPKNCDLTINGSWHGAGPCEWDFMGGSDCRQVIELIRERKNANN